jgi:hypothetical protein
VLKLADPASVSLVWASLSLLGLTGTALVLVAAWRGD